MGMIRYLVGRTVDSRQELLDRKMASDAFQSILHLVPTRGRVIELESDHRFWLKRRVDTLTGLIHHLFKDEARHKRYSEYRFIDAPLRSLLVKNILEKRSREPDGLIYFSNILTGRQPEMDFPGIYRAVLSFFSMLVRNNLADDFVNQVEGRIFRMNEGISGGGNERFALESDLVWLFGDYEEIKRDIKGYDEDDVISNVKSFLESGAEPLLVTNTDVIVFDGFDHLSRIEEDILYYIFTQVKEVWWLLDYDSQVPDPLASFKKSSGREYIRKSGYQNSNNNGLKGLHEVYRIFAPIVSFMERLEQSGVKHGIEKVKSSILPNTVAQGFDIPGTMDHCTSGEVLLVKSFADRIDEVRGIAGEIKRIIHDDGLDVSQDLGNIRIIFPNLDDYSPLLTEIFSDFGIPFSLTRGLSVASHPITRIFLKIFEVPLRSFQREDVFRLFSLDLICRYGDDSCYLNQEDLRHGLDEMYFLSDDTFYHVSQVIQRESRDRILGRPDIFVFDKAVRRCGLNKLGDHASCMGDKEICWVRDFYQDKLLHTKDRQGQEEVRQEYYAFLVQAILLKQKLHLFVDMLNQHEPQSITDLFIQILKSLGLPQNLLYTPENVENHISFEFHKTTKRDIKIYSILYDLIKASSMELQITKKIFQEEESYDLLYRFYTGFKNRLNSAFLLDERHPNVIRVSQWLETRGRSFDYIFAGGLTSDQFPFREDSNFILSNSPSPIFRIPDPIDQSRYLFSHILKNYRKRLYLSYPRLAEEKAVNPSFVLVDLKSMCKGVSLPGKETQTSEELFQWKDNPYFTSREELLNATLPKGRSDENAEGHFFPVNRIITQAESNIDELLRGIHSLASSWASDGLFEYDGMVSRSSGFEAFQNKMDLVFSPSQLEALANCPMRYLFEWIYGLQTIERHEAEIPSKDMGQHLHIILRIFYKQLREKSRNIADMGLPKAFLLAKEVIDDYFSGHTLLDRSEFFESQKRELREGLDQDFSDPAGSPDHREGIIASLLRFEEKALGDRVPQGFEYAFGYRQGFPVVFGKTFVRGYIDRFDQDEEDPEKVYIYDYKSGLIPSSNMIKKGLSFQLPIYMRALQVGFPFKKLSASFYAMKRDILLRENPFKQTIFDHYDDIKGIDMSGVCLVDDYVIQLTTLLQKGIFHHAEDESNCHYCEFRYACHKDVRRMQYLRDSGTDYGIYSGRKNLEKWKTVDDFRKRWKDVLLSMKKAVELKTASGRKGHFDAIMEFKEYLIQAHDSLPFFHDYIDELMAVIEDFQRKYPISIQ
jgi:hypothetical protein